MAKKDKSDKKKRKFLMKKFNSAASFGGFGAGLSSAMVLPMVFVDGGITLALTMIGGTTLLYGGIGYANDSKNMKARVSTSDANQRLHGQGWAIEMHEKLQEQLLLTYAAMNMYEEKPKRYKKLEEKKEKLLDTARDLAEFLIVVDKDGEPTGAPVLYLKRPLTGDEKEDYNARINPAKPGDDVSPKSFGL